MNDRRQLLSVRTTLILALAATTGVAVAALTVLSGQDWPVALLAAGAATATATGLFDQIIGDTTDGP
ncbi:hypothetical protein OHA72_42555 [Dactylosporangium sp. NBC_01737]|uniref:hypothetical protein n=1 Tax=Dactylosporangium sp. NBC_01737 TaxID=2975959 RepID=UPI002E0FECC9|nr:hypothetical protein OHA72_42555 [Dactylosporangium sp. NBC_01737]